MQLGYIEVVTSSGLMRLLNRLTPRVTRKYITYLICKGNVWRWFAFFLTVVVCSTSANVSCFPGIYSFGESTMLIQECSLCYLDAPCTLGGQSGNSVCQENHLIHTPQLRTIQRRRKSWASWCVLVMGRSDFPSFFHTKWQGRDPLVWGWVLVTYIICWWYMIDMVSAKYQCEGRHVWYFNKGSSLDSRVYSFHKYIGLYTWVLGAKQFGVSPHP